MRTPILCTILLALTACGAEPESNAAPAPEAMEPEAMEPEAMEPEAMEPDPIDAEPCAALPALHDAPGMLIEGEAFPSRCDIGCAGQGDDRYLHFVAPEAGNWRFDATQGARMRVVDDCSVEDAAPLIEHPDGAGARSFEVALEAGEAVVVGVYTEQQGDFEPFAQSFAVRAMRTDAPTGLPATCEGAAPLHDPASLLFWASEVEAEIYVCDLGCGGGQRIQWMFEAPADGIYRFEVGAPSEPADPDGDPSDPSPLDYGLILDPLCSLAPGAQPSTQTTASRGLAAGEVIGISAFVATSIVSYDRLESTQATIRLVARPVR